MLQALKSVQLVNRGLQQSRVARLQACSLRTLRQASVVTILFAEPPGTKVPPPAALKKTPKIVGKLVFLSPLVPSTFWNMVDAGYFIQLQSSLHLIRNHAHAP
jgi:hypothetical protein